MGRIASTVLVVALLGGTAAAFAITERLKLVPTPITAPRIDKVFSPVCGCESAQARIAFRLRRADRLTLTIVDGDGREVRRLIPGERRPVGDVTARWDGLDDDGRLVAEGSYRPRVRLADERRTIVLPNPILVDVTRPRVELVGVRPPVFSPDGDGRRDLLQVRYRVDEPARVTLFVHGLRHDLVRKRGQKTASEIRWYGIVRGRAVPAGRYRLRLRAVDLAGNVSAVTPAAGVDVRYVALRRRLVHARAGTRFGIRIDADAASVAWRFAGRRGSAPPGLLVLRAPSAPGRYRIVVSVGRREARAVVRVTPR